MQNITLNAGDQIAILDDSNGSLFLRKGSEVPVGPYTFHGTGPSANVRVELYDVTDTEIVNVNPAVYIADGNGLPYPKLFGARPKSIARRR